MTKAVQKRTLATRARLIEAATALVTEKGYGALRVEEVVQMAGVAKGTFFAHFADKDALMDLLIGQRIDSCLDEAELLAAPSSVSGLVEALMPLVRFMTCERYVFDVILRYSGAAAVEEIGHIATTFGRHERIVADWIAAGPFRRDVSPQLLSEGVQAFSVQSMALHFCALHNTQSLHDRLLTYLRAWLVLPPAG
jgi:AcrR family transcriptional regulator